MATLQKSLSQPDPNILSESAWPPLGILWDSRPCCEGRQYRPLFSGPKRGSLRKKTSKHRSYHLAGRLKKVVERRHTIHQADIRHISQKQPKNQVSWPRSSGSATVGFFWCLAWLSCGFSDVWRLWNYICEIRQATVSICAPLFVSLWVFPILL